MGAPTVEPMSQPIRVLPVGSSGPSDALARQLVLPIVWLALAVLGWLSFMSWQLWSERKQLEQTRQAQEANVVAAGKLRASLDTLAIATSLLADSGNNGARTVVEELRRNGITINPAAVPVSR